MAEMVLPGTYIEVRAEGLISPGRVVTGNIGIVGTAEKGPVDQVQLLGSLSEAKEIFGTSSKDQFTLLRALELIYQNGGSTVYAVRTANSQQETPATVDDYKRSLALLENETVNIVLLAGQDVKTSEMLTALQGHLNTTAQIKRERIGIIGSGFDKDGNDNLDEIAKHTINSDRLIFTAPGIIINGKRFSGGYLAAAVAGLIASLPVQASPTNKTLTLEALTTKFNSSQLEKLVSNRVLAVEERNGFRVVKGITTDDTAWRQITTRRIVDYAIYGVRASCDPYIGKLNNDRVRGAMKATLDAFLTRMVENEALVKYTLTVSATRDQEKAGEAVVTMTLMPTFSIDFIQVTMYLS
ncbi:MAG: phage tail sheath C-terminal domain-containing protein [Cyanobacteriota bacterium]